MNRKLQINAKRGPVTESLHRLWGSTQICESCLVLKKKPCLCGTSSPHWSPLLSPLDHWNLWNPFNRIRVTMGKFSCTQIRTSSSCSSEGTWFWQSVFWFARRFNRPFDKKTQIFLGHIFVPQKWRFWPKERGKTGEKSKACRTSCEKGCLCLESIHSFISVSLPVWRGEINELFKLC